MGGPEEETAVAVSDLKGQLDDLHLQFSSIKCEVYEAVRAFYTQSSTIPIEEAILFAKSWSSAEGGGEMHQRINMLEKNLLDTVEKLQNEDTDAHGTLAKSVMEYQRVGAQIETSKHVISTLRLLVTIDDQINAIEVYLDRDELLSAAKEIIQVESNLNQLPKDVAGDFPESADVDLFQVIQNQFISCKTRFDYRIKEIFQYMCIIDQSSIQIISELREVNHQLLPHSITLDDVWQAMSIGGILDEQLKDLVQVFKKNVFKILLQSTVNLNQTTTGSVTTLTWTARTNTGTIEPIGHLEQFCSHLQKVFDFLYAQLLVSSELKSAFGTMLWSSRSGLSSKVTDLLTTAVPDDNAGLDTFRSRVLECVGGLEKHLIEIGAIKSTACILNSFLTDLNRFYANKKRLNVLSKAREIMKNDYINSVTISDGTERTCFDSSSSKKAGKVVSHGYFRLPVIQVTKCIHLVVELAHQTLLEACKMNKSCATVLVQTARDVLLLFRAVIPTMYQDDLVTDPRHVMLYYNDCLYTAHHMLIMGHQYKAKLPDQIPTTMVDLVPGVRESGKETLNKYIDTFAGEMITSLTRCPSFSVLDAPELSAQAESIIKGTLHRLQRVGSIWKGGFEEETYQKSFGTVLHRVLDWCIETLISQLNVPIEASRQVIVLLRLFEEIDGIQTVENFVTFKTLTHLLDRTISEIAQDYRNGQLPGVTSDQVATILCAYFHDSSDRESFLTALRQL